MGVVEIDGYEVKISNEDKILYKEVDVTKGDIIDYYKRIYLIIKKPLRSTSNTSSISRWYRWWRFFIKKKPPLISQTLLKQLK
jgi:DNA primase